MFLLFTHIVWQADETYIASDIIAFTGVLWYVKWVDNFSCTEKALTIFQ